MEENGKHLVKTSSEKESLTLLKQKHIFEETANDGMGKIHNLSKQISFINLIYDYKVKNGLKKFISFKGALAFRNNIKDGCTTIENAEESP